MHPLRLTFFSVLLLFTSLACSQSNSCDLRISLLTCSPGAELYSAFGHTAIRVTDQQRGMDLVFNYGTFNDEDPDFYLNFTKGLMNYALSCYPFSNFIEEYQFERRGVTEQELKLNCVEKQKLFEALRTNTLDENRFYNYYFHTDNCTTRARDIIRANTDEPVGFKNILPEKTPTYRNLIHEYLDKGGQYWSKLGIDILLGSNLDKKVNNEQAMFLPDYLAKGFDNAETSGHKLVSETKTLLPVTFIQDSSIWFTPNFLFTTLFLIITALSFFPKTKSTKIWLAFDFIFFLSLGLMSLLLCVLWLVRIDDVCRNNYNLLWALPFHLLTPFILFLRSKKWTAIYFKIIFFLSILAGLSWCLVPQQLNTALVPVLGIIVVRLHIIIKKLAYR